MNRLGPYSENELRHLAYAIVQRLDVLADQWVAGAAPTPQHLGAAADDIAGLRDLIAASHDHRPGMVAPSTPRRFGSGQTARPPTREADAPRTPATRTVSARLTRLIASRRISFGRSRCFTRISRA